MSQEKPMREVMPVVAEWVDALRKELGKELIDRQIRSGMRGFCTFWAQERGPDGVVREIGSRR